MVWQYHDDHIAGPAAPVKLTITGLSARSVLLHHYRVDHQHSNAYEVWQQMRAPQNPTPAQYAVLEKAGQLALFDSPKWINPSDGSIMITFELPRQAVSLLKLNWD